MAETLTSSAAMEKRTLLITSLIHGVQDGILAMLYVMAPLLAASLGLSLTQVGLLKAVRSGTAGVFELPAGLIAERFGERRLLAFGLACAGGGYLALGSAQAFGFVLACLALAGLGGAFQHALCSSVLSRAHRDETRSGALGLYNSSGDAGKLIFTGAFGALVGIGWTWNALVVWAGAAALALSGWVWFALRAFENQTPEAEAAAGETAASGDWGILDRRGLVGLSSAILFDTGVQSGFMVFLPFLFVEKGFSVEWASLAVVATLLGGIFGKAGCGFLAQRLGATSAFVCIQAATVIGILALLAAPGLLAFVVLPLLGLFLQGSTSITYSAVAGLFRSDRQSRGYGLVYSVTSIGSVSGPVLFGLIGDRLGLSAAALAMALASLLALLPVALQTWTDKFT